MEGQFSRDQFGRHFVMGWSQRHCFTVLTKDETCGRGEYAEELDILAGTVGEAKKIARVILDADYEPGLRISRVLVNW